MTTHNRYDYQKDKEYIEAGLNLKALCDGVTGGAVMADMGLRAEYIWDYRVALDRVVWRYALRDTRTSTDEYNTAAVLVCTDDPDVFCAVLAMEIAKRRGAAC